MPLEEYREKRDFEKTHEPEGSARKNAEDSLCFVIQKHAARRLHYDLRLELDGVLKSWAVPKGPSLDPHDRKLATQTEDHPLDYRHFEGIIAEGNYGAGTMIIWDQGTYHAIGKEGRAESEDVLRAGLEQGNLKFVLNGQKLRGEFLLVRMKNDPGDNWLLIKKDDEHASSEENVLDLDYSVKSGATLEELRERETPLRKKDGSIDRHFLEALVKKGAKKTSMPENVQPMLATLTGESFDRMGWIFEIKWDGYRSIAEVRKREAKLYSRHQLDFTEMFSPVVDDLYKLGFEAILDGEVVVVDEAGRSQIKLLQHYRRTGQGTLVYYVFDLLYLNGYDLQSLPLDLRKSILKQVLPALPRIKYSDHIETQGTALFEVARKNEVEGILAKDKNSRYRQNVRSSEWLKIKAYRQQEAVIGGFTQPRGSRKDLGAILLGVYVGKDLVYVGHTGGGFGEADLTEVKSRLEPLIQEKSPFKKKPKANAPVTWVKPELVCEVRFIDWSKDALMLQPTFLGLREDKDPQQVRRETAVPTIEVLEQQKFAVQEEEKEIIEIEGQEVNLTNQSKVYWPDHGYTKGDLVDYYRQVAPYILPHLIDRPESLHRFPDGIQGKSFFQKDFDNAPEWVKTERIESESQGPIDYLICQNEATLVYMANLGCIEINPWNSRLQSLDQPDYLVIDIDPFQHSFDEVVLVAGIIHQALEQLEAPNFVKTSGQRGLHVYVPLGARFLYEQARQFAHLVCQLVNRRLPEITTLERSPKKRQGKIYLDYLQNRRGQTLAAPYSVRPRPGAPVSTPLGWDELKAGITPADFTLRTMPNRVKERGDVWKDLISTSFNMEKSLSLLMELWKKG
jgi:bifunctional non-homologous end joining protein LigD